MTPTGGTSPGRFHVLDGVDGCGKSTQAERLCAHLESLGRPRPLHLREPGSTPAGERIRALALDPGVRLGPAPQALLMAAARRQMLDELVRPALEAGRDVVCERFHPSTFAYQGAGGGLDEERVLTLLATWAGDPAPDVVILLDLPLDRALERRSGVDRFERGDAAFQERVAAGYRRYAERVEGVAVVDADGTVDDVAARVWEEVERADR